MASDEQPNLSGPHLQLAAFCEKVLIEPGSVISLIRVIDRFNVNGPTPEMAAVTLTFFVVISFKAGFVRGKHVIRIVPVSPTHVDMPAIEMPQFFEGDDDRGVVIASQMNFVVTEEGLYWFRVYFESAVVTQMPLRVVYQQVGSAGPAAG